MQKLDFTPVRITTIKAEREVPFSLFIYFKDQYLEYLTPGNAIEKGKYKKLRRQKITKFFIKSEDESGYQKFLDDFLEQTLNSKDTSVDDKVEAVSGQSETAMEQLSKDPASESSFNMTRKAAKNLQKLIFENPEALTRMFGQQSEAGPIIQHCINVAILSIKFAKKKKIDDESIDYLSTAALMHDIGLIQDESDEMRELFNKPKSELGPKEKVTYYAHCKGVVKMLSERPYINNKVIEMIEYHEENLQGSGPHKKGKLTKPQEILSMVNSYDKKITAKSLSPAAAIKEMMIDELGNYNLDLLNDFQAFLKEEKIIG